MSKTDDVKKDIQKFTDLSVIAETKGGKLLVSSLQKDIVSSVDELAKAFKTASHVELIALCARLSERLTLLRVLNRSKKLKKLAQEELTFLLQEGE